MFRIENGRAAFWQWDVNQRIVVADDICSEVHFCNRTGDCSLVCRVYDHNGQRVADVPNILLQQAVTIHVYAYVADSNEKYTKQEAWFSVLARTKPADYVYTETELYTVEEMLEEVLQAAKESGDFKGDKGDKGDAGSVKFLVVAELPTEGIDESAIYLVPTASPEELNTYDEYIYTNGSWECIGSASVEVNLDEYVKKPANPARTSVLSMQGDGTILTKQLVHESAAPWSVPARDGSGGVVVANPTLPEHATSKQYVDNLVGDIETALDSIIAIQNELIGGDAE